MGIALLIIGSCSTSNLTSDHGIQKRKHRKCWSTEKRMTSLDNNVRQEAQHVDEPEGEVYLDNATILVATDDSNIALLFESAPIESETELDKQPDEASFEHITATVTKPVSTKAKCDIIMLKNGAEIEAKVTEIGSYEIKYKLCDNLEGPVYTKQKSEIFKIKYAYGTSTLISEIKTTQPATSVFNEPNQNASPRDNTKSLMWMAIAGIILGGLSFFIFGLLFSAIAIGLGVTALILLNKKKPENRSRKVRNLSIWSIVIGAIVFALTLFLTFY